MSPQEQAREIVKAWTGIHYDPNRAPIDLVFPVGGDRSQSHVKKLRPLIDAIATALAASAAKVKQYERESADENTCAAHPKTMLVYHCAACADALTAKLQASERDRDSDRQSLMEVLKRLQESEEARGASERALERVRNVATMLARCLREAGRGDLADVAMAEPYMQSLASPEARATGEGAAQ